MQTIIDPTAPIVTRGFYNANSSQRGWGTDYAQAMNATYSSTDEGTMTALYNQLLLIKELKGSGKINFTKEGIFGERKYLVPWVFPDGQTTWIDFCMLLM